MSTLLLPMFLPGAALGQQEADSFYLVDIDGIIVPAVASYIENSITQAEGDGSALIIRMDTPGGLEDAMRDIVRMMLAARVPVIVYVAPDGARAASAGVFITYAADIAAMHPSTNIGAAHPVALGEGQVDEETMEKILQDSVAYIRGLARARGRNEQWAEDAVRESVSIIAPEALELGVIDLVSQDLESLLEDIHGLTIEKHGEQITLMSIGAPVEEIQPGFVNRFLQIVSNPNVAYILFILGLMGIIYEFAQPGLGIAGSMGALFLILALYAFNILPINFAGVGLIVLAIVLFVLDFALGTEGVLSVAGVAALVTGSFLLIDSPAGFLNISRPLIIGASAAISGFLIMVIRAVYLAQRRKPSLGAASFEGKEGVTVSTLNPEGQIKIGGEIWKAMSADGKKIGKNKKVIIQKSEGLTLYVKKIEEGG